jgi:hypothetical protein
LQLEQPDASRSSEYWPFPHDEQSVAPTAEKTPARHEVQEVEPVLDWYRPAAQLVHDVAEDSGWYLPSGQLEQADAPVSA